MHDTIVIVARFYLRQVAGLGTLFGHVEQAVDREYWLRVIQLVIRPLAKVYHHSPTEIVVLVYYIDQATGVHEVNDMLR